MEQVMLVKDKLRYFSHDVDMRNDLKIRGLRRKFGNDGYAVWCYLLEVLTDTEELAIDIDDMTELLAADFDVQAEELREIVDYCVKVRLLVKEGAMVYSIRHRERLQYVYEKKGKVSEARAEAGRKGMQKRWNAVTSANDVITSDNNSITSDNNSITSDNNSITSDNNSITSDNLLEKKREEKKREEKRVEYPCDGVVRLWNEICTSLPKVMRLSDARREKVKARLKEWGGDKDKMLDNARSLFLRIERSDFLTGRSGKWKASFDWLFDNGKNWVKVTEGNYDNKDGVRSPRTASTAQGGQLGVGEYIDGSGRRTYGTGRATIPNDAPPRPSERYSWDAASNSWVML